MASSSTTTTTTKKTIVIVGLSYAGTAVARVLDDAPLAGKAYEIIGIDTKTHFWNALATGRALVNAEYASKSIALPYDHLLKHGKVLAGTTVVSVEANAVVTDKGERVPFDYLCLTTGSTYHSFIKAPNGVADAQAKMAELRGVISKAGAKVVVVGAGLSGLEYAGEIKTAYPETKVTIVDAHKDVLGGYSDYTDGGRKDIKTKLTKIGVEFVFGERIVIPSAEEDPTFFTEVKPRVLALQSGTKTLESDAIIFSIGAMKPDSTAFNKGFLGDKLDGDGRLKVNEFLQVEGHENIYAFGDIGNVKVVKTGMRAALEGDYVGASIATLFKNAENHKKAAKPIKPYVVSPPQNIAVVVLNNKTGTAINLPSAGSNITGWLGNQLSKAKGADMGYKSIATRLKVPKQK